MNIKTRLALQFSLIVTGILIFLSLLVYYFSYSAQLGKFREYLLERAQNTAIMLIDVTEVDSVLMKKIHQSTISLHEEEIAIADSNFNVLYSYNIGYLNTLLMRSNKGRYDQRYFSLEEKDGVYSRHQYGNRQYYVYVMAFDESRKENLHNLSRILFWATLFSILLSVLFSYFFSKKAMKPISDIIHSVREINSLKLGNRLDEGNRKDEIAQLAITFNRMLTDLEIAFRNQQEFFSNASHELRTPLTVMIGESDYLLSHEQDKEKYINHISGLLDDLRKINVLLNSLLELAQINIDKNLPFSDIRIDETVFNAVHNIHSKYSDRKIIPKIVYPESSNDLLVYGNTGLLEIAFRNLLDNACKFSNDEVIIEFTIDSENIRIVISDRGIGIPPGEIEAVYQPFKRGSNVKYMGGFGVGLSLVRKILDLHRVDLRTESHVNEGTRFEMIFRKSV